MPETTWTQRLARRRTGLAALSFAESTVVPVPLEALVVPLMIGQHRSAMVIATAIWLGSMAGAALFYAVGALLAGPVVEPVLAWLGLGPAFAAMTASLTDSGLFWTVFLVSFSPVPMQLATLGAGSVGGSFPVFLAAIAASRALRYFGLALLALYLGPRVAQLQIPTGLIVLGLMVVLLGVWGAMQLR
jgi:membrane protein YqaA with SNARE-associated domain